MMWYYASLTMFTLKFEICCEGGDMTQHFHNGIVMQEGQVRRSNPPLHYPIKSAPW